MDTRLGKGQDLAKSQEIKIDGWRQRGPWSRFMETIAPAFADSIRIHS